MSNNTPNQVGRLPASRPISRAELLRFRLRQEQVYTIISAQLVADERWIPSKKELVSLERLARSHFGLGFYDLVDENDLMLMENMEKFHVRRKHDDSE